MKKHPVVSPANLTLDGSQFVLNRTGKLLVRTLVGAGFPEPTWEDMLAFDELLRNWKASGREGFPPISFMRTGASAAPTAITLF